MINKIEKGKQYINKWNGDLYTVLSVEGSTVTLQREKGRKLTILISDFKFGYRENGK